jgi:hypothetical protein
VLVGFFIVPEVPFEVGVDDGQVLELLLCQAGEDGFEEVCEDVFAAPPRCSG